MVDELLHPPVFADVEIPCVAGRVTAVRWILHGDQLGRAVALWQWFHTLITGGGAFVPVSMEWEQQPVVIVDERRIDFVLHIVRLGVQLRTQIGDLYRLTVLIFSIIGDLILLWLPNPGMRETHPGKLCVPRIANRYDLPELIKPICSGNLCDVEGRGLGSLFGIRRLLFLRTGGGHKNKR